MTPEGKAALADIFLKSLNNRIDKSEADCKRYHERIAKLERENAKLREACEAIVGAWDGSLGEDAYNAAVGLAEEKIRAALAQEGERE